MKKKDKQEINNKLEKIGLFEEKTFWAIILLLSVLAIISFFYDKQISLAIEAIRSPLLDKIMIITTDLMGIYLGMPILVLLIYFKEKKKDKRVYRKIIISMVINLGIS